MIKILADENVHISIVQGIRQRQYEVLFIPEIGLTGSIDIEILKYSIQNNLILISGDKDFGGLIEFGRLWGKGRVILLRYRQLFPEKIVNDIIELLKQEEDIFTKEKSFVIVLSESGYRIHIPNS